MFVENGGVRRRLWAGWDTGSQGQADHKGSWAQAKELSFYIVQEPFCLSLVLAFCFVFKSRQRLWQRARGSSHDASPQCSRAFPRACESWCALDPMSDVSAKEPGPPALALADCSVYLRRGVLRQVSMFTFLMRKSAQRG